jgi:hypothetical protein
VCIPRPDNIHVATPCGLDPATEDEQLFFSSEDNSLIAPTEVTATMVILVIALLLVFVQAAAPFGPLRRRRRSLHGHYLLTMTTINRRTPPPPNTGRRTIMTPLTREGGFGRIHRRHCTGKDPTATTGTIAANSDARMVGTAVVDTRRRPNHRRHPVGPYHGLFSSETSVSPVDSTWIRVGGPSPRAVGFTSRGLSPLPVWERSCRR